MTHLTHTQDEILWLSVIVGSIWTVFWLWVGWMAVRVLRWTYLEKKYDWSLGTSAAPVPPPPVRSWR